MYKVLETYQRFNQKNNMFYRTDWDPAKKQQSQLRRETMMKFVKRDVPGYGLKDFSLTNACGVLANNLGTGINRPNSGLTSWEPLPAFKWFKFPERRPQVDDAVKMTRQIKRVARYLGADLAGVAPLDMKWIYSHHYSPEMGESKPIELDERYRYVISMAVEMDREIFKTTPSILAMANGLHCYSKMAFLVAAMAQFIREIGYHAIPSLNDTGLNIPIAVDAGLGQLGRFGVLITPQFGPRQRLYKVITDLPLQPDHPIDFGVTEFCAVCRKCARQCPAQAISYGEPTAEGPTISNNPGVMKWHLNAEKCSEFLSSIATNGGVCVRVCPFNKSKAVLHRAGHWMVKHARPLNPVMVKMDDYLGYGKYVNPRYFWE